LGRFGGAVGAGLLVALCGTTAEAAVRHVVVLQSLERGTLALDQFAGQLRIDVQRRLPEPVTFTEFVVNPSGFAESPETAIIDFLRSAFADQPKPDLVVTVGGPAAAFARKHRRQLFPESPFLFAALDRRFLEDAPLAADETAVAVDNDFGKLVDEILHLFPGTSHVFMVVDSTPVGRFWQRDLRREFQRFGNRITFTWSDALSFDQILQRVSVLPPHSAICFVALRTDAQGGSYPEERVLQELHAAANAPLFAAQSAQMGHGIVGGSLTSVEAAARTSAEVVLRLLNGEPPSAIRVPIQKAGPGVYDWRELRRWDVSESRLPPGSVVRHREPGLWRRFKWFILAGASALLAQAVLIGALLLSRVKRRRAEQALRESEGRFRVLANSAPVMIRMCGADLRGTDFNLQWLAFTGRVLPQELGTGWLEGMHPEDVVRYLESSRRALERREPFRIEYRLRRPDGEYRWLLDSSEPRFTPDGSLLGYISSAVDVTELKAARAALSSLSGRLMEAQDQERSRLASELHDDVSQRISFLTMDLARIRAGLSDGAAEARGEMAALYDAMLALGRDIQGISRRLHTSRIKYLGLAAAARSLCEEVSGHGPLTIEYVEDGVPATLAERVAVNLFRVLQEALSNVVKHSGARHCRVTLRGAADQLMLEVVDEGRGFDGGAASQRHGLGLISMQERLKLVGGEVVIESRLGRGTTVQARVPLRAPVVEPERHSLTLRA
jgi:PAS domain S-box-containing protein